MKLYKTIGIVPKLVNSKLRIFAFVNGEIFEQGKEQVKTLDDYLEENPVTFSGLGEFQAISVGVGYCPIKEKNKNKFGYNLVKVDPDFHIGEIDLQKKFAKTFSPDPQQPKVTFKDITDFINWVNDSSNIPERLKTFETVDGYVEAIRSALSILTDKILTDYKFNQLISGVNGQPVSGLVNVGQDEQGDITSSMEKEDMLKDPEPANSKDENSRQIAKTGTGKQISNGESKHFSETLQKKFSDISIPDPDTNQYSQGNLIGTLVEAEKYLRLYHWLCNDGEYAQHKAFEECYENLDYYIDSLAEKCINRERISQFKNEIFPKGCPIDYMKRLKEYIINASGVLFSQLTDKSSYQSLIDDITNEIDHCLYQLQRLGTAKTFSEKRKTFSTE